MIDLERQLGPLTVRAWGLVLNFAFNALALWGLSHVVRGAGGTTPLVIGVAGTVLSVAVLAKPSR